VKSRRYRNASRGFSLTEILVATAVFVVILVAALMIYDQSNKIFKKSLESADVQQNTRIGFDRLVRDVRMAGFDFDRDGFPMRATEFQQPDEQIEYAGAAAIVFRANADYNADISREHGRECAPPRPCAAGVTNYEPTGGQFPIVTISNEEIVAYALRRSGRPVTDNPSTITFAADMAIPRAAYPGGSAETAVTIPNVDLTNSSPPYTLYRFSFTSTSPATVVAVPVAENIRSLRFNYYRDIRGSELVYRTNPNDIAQGAVGGAGLFDPNAADPAAATDFDDRELRAAIRAVEVNLVGMNAVTEKGYVSPIETALPVGSQVAAARSFRQYELRSLIVPRNLGIRGIVESDPNPPGPANITGVCAGHCGLMLVTWDPPITGTVDFYRVRYGTAAGGNYTTVGADNVLSTSAGISGLTPGVQYYFEVLSVNINGQTPSNVLPNTATNRTKPNPPASLTATNSIDGTAVENKVVLSFPASTTNAASNRTLSCTPSGTPSAPDIHPLETIRYRIWRGTSANFDPTAGQGQLILDSTSAALLQPSGAPGTNLTFEDSATTSLAAAGGPANCTTYYYRIQAYDRTCSTNAAYNTPNDVNISFSDVFPPIGTDAIRGESTTDRIPAAPASLTVAPHPQTKCLPGPNTCDITLEWPKVTTTVPVSAPITVDHYKLRRYKKKAAGAWPATPDAVIDITGVAAMAGTNGSYEDENLEYRDPGDNERWYYRYILTADLCGQESTDSPPVEYPTTCLTASVSSSAAGAGSDLDPFLADNTDSITFSPATAVTNVKFDVYLHVDPPDPSATPVYTTTLTSAPYSITWPGGTDLQLYRVVITATTATCQELFEVYVQDQPLLCPTVTTTAVGAPGAGSAADPWIMNAGDRVSLTVAAPATINLVVFSLFVNSSGTAVGTPATVATSPFNFNWVDRTDSTLYRLNMVITYADGCTETIDRFIRDAICTGGTVTSTGQSAGSGTAASPWVMNAGDLVTYAAPTGTTISSISSVLTPVTPAGTALAAVVDSASPFTYNWTDRTDNTVYSLVTTVTYSSGCTEVLTHHIRDEALVCSLTVDDPDNTILTKPARRVLNLLLDNTYPANLTLESIIINWTNPDPSKLIFSNVQFPSGAQYPINTQADGTITLVLNPVPTGFASTDVVVPLSSSLSLALNFGLTNGNPEMQLANITSICVRYRNAATGSSIYSCRIKNSTAPDAHANNPTSCN
jgi:prepilin-type N-terminal cleavage/methylation domain-containing protein